MATLIDLWWWWWTGVEKGVKNYSHGLGRNLQELAIKTLTFCHIVSRVIPLEQRQPSIPALYP